MQVNALILHVLYMIEKIIIKITIFLKKIVMENHITALNCSEWTLGIIMHYAFTLKEMRGE